MANYNSSFDYLTKDYKGYKQAMIERLKVLMPEYTDLSETDAGIVILELASVGLDILSAYLDSQANESLLVSAELWSSVLKWAKMLSYEPRFATSSLIQQVFVLKAVSDTDTIIQAGTQIKTSEVTNENPVYFETINNLTIPAGKLGNEVDDDGNYLYTAKALQGLSILGETIGSSNGAKDQEFKLGYSPVLYDTIEVWCDGIKWTKAENNSFVNSESGDTHYTITMSDRNEAFIVFGDNVFGKIPPKDKNITAYYRIGGGVSGNVSPNTVTQLVASDARIESTFNPYPPEQYGQDRESIKSIKLSAPALSRTTWGALTLSDFSDIILANFPEIKMAKAIRGDTASYADIFEFPTTVDDVVIGLVQNKEGSEFEPVAVELADRLIQEFNTRKLAGMNEFYFMPVTEVPITRLEVTVSVLSDYLNQLPEIASQIKEAFIHYFDLGNVAIDATVTVGDIEKYIFDNVTGINTLRITEISDYSGKEVSDLMVIRPIEGKQLQLLTVKEETLSWTVNALETASTFSN